MMEGTKPYDFKMDGPILWMSENWRTETVIKPYFYKLKLFLIVAYVFKNGGRECLIILLPQ